MRRARVEVLLAAICFGTTGTAQALGPSAPPVGVGAARILVGGALLLLVARWLGARLPTSPRAVLGIAVAVAVYQLSFFAAVKLTGVAVGTVVAIGTGPAIAGLLGRALNGEQLTRRWAGATALACAGVVLLVLGDGGASIDVGGVALAMVSGAGYATYTVLSKGLLDRGERPEGIMAAGFGGAAVLLLPALLLADPSWLGAWDGAAVAVYLGAIPTALAYVLFARGLRHLSSGETTTIVLAEPLTAALLGVVALGEDPSVAAGLGAALVLAGLVVLALPERRRPTAGEVVLPA